LLKNVLEQMHVLDLIFEAALDNAGTKNEAKAWFNEWKKGLAGIPADDPNHKEKMEAFLSEMGVHIDYGRVPDYGTDLDKLWSKNK